MIVRPAQAADAAGVQAIYAWHVLNGAGTFEEAPPTVDDMAGRIAAVLERGLPYRVAEEDGAVLAFAYASPFRPRAAYRYTAEDSVYVAPGMQRRGLGRAVLAPVIDACREIGLRRLVAVIGDTANAGSTGLHRALGFQDAGMLPGVGFKGGRFIDVVMMELALNGGAEGVPDAPGLNLTGH